MTLERRHNLQTIRELLLVGFTVEELRSLFAFAMSRELRPLADEFVPEDGKPAMVRKAISYCRSRFLLDELLAEIKEANPRAYSRFVERLFDAVAARGTSAPVLPLPADLADFSGRDAQIDQILTRLDRQGAVPIVGIHGMGGIGKTALAIRVAHRLIASGCFSDAQLIIDLKGPDPEQVDPAEALDSLLNAILGPTPGRPRDLDTLAALWRQAIHGKDAILILDNAADAAQVRPLLPDCRSCAVLVTSRQRFVLPGAGRLDLDPMQPDEARTMLRELAPHLDAGGADTIVESCGRLPLALRVAGNYMSLNDDVAPDVYAAMLEGERTRLARLRDPDDPRLDVAAAIFLSVIQLDMAQRQAWALLALFPAPFDLGAAAALWGKMREGAPRGRAPLYDDLWTELQEGEGFDPEEWDDGRVSALRQLLEMLTGPLESRPSLEALDEDEARARLQALRNRSLLSYDSESGRYLQHDLVRLAAVRDLETLEEQVVEAARLRLARHYEGVARRAKERYQQGGEGVLEGMALFDLEWPHIRAGQAWAASRAGGGGEAAWLCSDYPDAAAVLLSLRLHPRDWIAWLEAATRAARRLGDRQAEELHLGSLGLAYRNLGELDWAADYGQQALEMARQLKDRRGEGAHLGNLGSVYLSLGEIDKAIESYTAALAIARELGDRGSAGSWLGDLAIAYQRLGKTEEAIQHYAAAMEIARETGDRRNEGYTLGNLGTVFLAAGEVDKAVDHFERALKIARQIGDRSSEGKWLAGLGGVYRDQGDTVRARDYWRKALVAFEAVGSPDVERVRRLLSELED